MLNFLNWDLGNEQAVCKIDLKNADACAQAKKRVDISRTLLTLRLLLSKAFAQSSGPVEYTDWFFAEE